jgi:hypothetical protein
MGFFSAMANLINPPVVIYIVIGRDRSIDSELIWISDVFEEYDHALRYLHGKTVKYMDLKKDLDIHGHIPQEILLKFFYKFCDEVDCRAKQFSVHGIAYDILEWEIK